MSDFRAHIVGQVDLSKAKSDMESFLQQYKNDLRLNVKIDGIDNNLQKQFQSVGKQASTSFKKGFSLSKSPTIKEFTNLKQGILREVNKTQKEISKITGSSFELKSVDSKMVDKWANEYVENQVKSYKKSQKKYQKIREKESSSYANAYTDAYQSIGKKSNIQKQMSAHYINLEKEALRSQKEYQKIRERINRESSSGLYEYRDAKNQEFLSKYKGQDSEAFNRAKTQIEKIKTLQNELKTGIYASGDNKGLEIVKDDQIAKVKQLDTLVDQLSNSMKQVGLEFTKTLDDGVATRSADKVKAYSKENTKALKRHGQELEKLEDDYRRITTQGEKLELDKRFNNLKARISSEGLTGKSAFDDFKRAFSQITQFAGVYGMIQDVIFEIPRQVASAVKDIDNSIVDLQMATGISNTKAQELISTYFDMGKQLRATATDISASSTEWMKQGKTIEESQKLAKYSIILSKIGGLSSEDSTSTITAAMKSYDLAESEVMGFIDKISAIDMASATDVGGLANAFNKVAANARNAGVESEKVLAYAATIGETTQEGMDSVGTSLNAIFSRMGNIKLSRLKDPETDEDLNIWGVAA